MNFFIVTLTVFSSLIGNSLASDDSNPNDIAEQLLSNFNSSKYDFFGQIDSAVTEASNTSINANDNNSPNLYKSIVKSLNNFLTFMLLENYAYTTNVYKDINSTIGELNNISNLLKNPSHFEKVGLDIDKLVKDVAAFPGNITKLEFKETMELAFRIKTELKNNMKNISDDTITNYFNDFKADTKNVFLDDNKDIDNGIKTLAKDIINLVIDTNKHQSQNLQDNAKPRKMQENPAANPQDNQQKNKQPKTNPKCGFLGLKCILKQIFDILKIILNIDF